MKFHHISDGKNITKNNRQKITARGKSLSRKHVSLAPFAVLAVFAVATIASPVFLGNNFARADSYDTQISANNQKISDQQTVAQQALAQAGSYQAAINQLQSQIDSLNSQISQNQQEVSNLESQIEQKNQQIKVQSQALVATLQNIYYDDQSNSTLNILMNSNSISDYVDAQARQAGVQDNLQKSIDNINSLKKQLSDQKVKVQGFLNAQTAKKQQIASNQSAQQQLLAQSSANAATANATIKDLQDQNTQLKAQQLAALRAAAGSNSSRSIGGSDSYPFGNAPSGFDYKLCYSDSFGFKNSGTCKWECASYVEWEVYVHTGINATNSGDAATWWSTWKNIRGDRYSPKPNSAVVWGIGYYGHIAWVESVNSPTDIVISEYNADGTGQFSRVEINPQTYMGGTLLGYLYF